jgi:purine nucleosidase
LFRQKLTTARLQWIAFPLLVLACGRANGGDKTLHETQGSDPVPGTAIHLIVDTDAGTDDLIALAMIVSDGRVELEAVTVVDGLSSVPAGVSNVRRLLASMGKGAVPVLAGSTERLQLTKRFPSDWRSTTESAPDKLLPRITGVDAKPAADEYLAAAFSRNDSSLRLLTLGPLTNVALALRRIERAVVKPIRVTVMGGAVAVPGNLISFNDSSGLNHFAEWNVFFDPQAADEVFNSSALAVTLVPLDVTQSVKITPCIVAQMRGAKRSLAGEFVLGLFGQVTEWIQRGDYFAWDPVAAGIAIGAVPYQGSKRSVRVERSRGAELGRSVAGGGGAEITVAETIKQEEYLRWFRTSLLSANADSVPSCR